MASVKEQEHFEAVDGSEIVKDLDSNDDEVENGIVVIDGDGNYYYQTSDKKLVKIENLVSETAVEYVDATAVTAAAKSNSTAKAAKTSTKKTKRENKSEQKNNLNETTSSTAENQEEVYEFNENEQDADDPQAVTEAKYESKGVVKNIKKSKADETFSCVVCPYKTNKKFLLSKHLKNHSEERPYKCSVCERGFKTSASLLNHRNTHLGLKPHACKDCDKAFTTSGELVRHVRYRHTHIKPHKCTECEYSSVEMSKLRRHMRCHTGERPYQCPHCTYASPDTFKLKRHLRTHTGEKPYECDICHARFTQLNSLKYHRLIHSVNEKPVFQCHLCPTTCGRKTDLRLHIKKLHTSDQPIPCKRCGKELPDRYSYKVHIKTHQGEKCYRCEYCPYASVSARHLESHVFIHLDEKPFVCPLCETNFRQKQLYTRHMKMYHSDNYVPPQPRKKDHKCPHCDKMFAFNGNLIRHMETHDPTSRLSEEKYNLKLGRMKRVQKDGTIVTEPANKLLTALSDEYTYGETEEPQVKNEDFNEEDYEEDCTNEDIHYVYEEFETDDCDEEAQEYETEEELDINGKKLLIDVKMETIDGMDTVQPQQQQKMCSKPKNNKTTEDEISLEANDDQGFMVIEVLPDDEDDAVEDEAQIPQDNSPRIVYVKDKPSTSNETEASEYFGFEVDEEEEEDDEEAKLLEMIEQEQE